MITSIEDLNKLLEEIKYNPPITGVFVSSEMYNDLESSGYIDLLENTYNVKIISSGAVPEDKAYLTTIEEARYW